MALTLTFPTSIDGYKQVQNQVIGALAAIHVGLISPNPTITVNAPAGTQILGATGELVSASSSSFLPIREVYPVSVVITQATTAPGSVAKVTVTAALPTDDDGTGTTQYRLTVQAVVATAPPVPA